MMLKEKEFNQKLIDGFVKLKQRADLDKMIYGNAFYEITDRKIEIINPEKINIKRVRK